MNMIETFLKQYSGPCFAYDAIQIQKDLKQYQLCLGSCAQILYSVKTNPLLPIMVGLQRSGAGMEVSSLYELHLALRAGTPPNDIVFVGPGKSREELEACFDLSIYAIYCESIAELDQIEATAQRLHRRINVALRVNQGYTNNEHQIAMSGPTVQFGIDNETLNAINEQSTRWPHLGLLGFHYYEGSNQCDVTLTRNKIERCCKHFHHMAKRWHRPLEFIGLGLGVGMMQDNALAAVAVNQAWEKSLLDLKASYPTLRILCEAGRSLVARSGNWITQVRYTKKLHYQNWAVLDSGYHHHMSLCFENNYLKKHPTITIYPRDEHAHTGPETEYRVCGPLCTPSDRMHTELYCPMLRSGDFMVFQHVGAYAWNHSPFLFLGHPPPDFYLYNPTHQTITACDGIRDYFEYHYRGKPYEPNRHDFRTNQAVPTQNTGTEPNASH